MADRAPRESAQKPATPPGTLDAQTLGAVLRGLPVGVWVAKAPGGEFLYANDAFEQIMGMGADVTARAGEYSGPYGIFGRDGKPFPEAELPFPRALSTRKTVTVDGIVIHRRDGSRVHVRAFGKPLLGPSGEVALVMVSFCDVTAEVEAELAGATAQQRLELAVHRAPIAIWTMDAQGIITLSEGAGLKAVGVRSGELVGKSLFELFRDDAHIISNARRALAGEALTTRTQVREGVLEGWVGPMRDDHGTIVGIIGVTTDVTDRDRAQQSASRSERMAAMGTLAASVAHEINNPLAYVLEGLRSIERELGSGTTATVKQLLNDVKEGAERVRVITSDLQTFTRRDEARAPVDVAGAVRTAVQMLASQLEAHARLHLDLQDGVIVEASEPRIVQVLMNLLLNALYAVREAPQRERHEIRVRVAGSRGEAIIEVTDSGPGITPELTERIFEPFVTTKPVGMGSGLGLFVCRNLIAELNGKIEAENITAGGARFKVIVPRLAAPQSRRGARVLVIDDNVNLGRVMASALELQRHQVSVVHSGREAVEQLVGGAAFDVIFCDLMMADVSGMDVYDELKRRRPGAEDGLVFMTGGAFTDRAQRFLASVPNERLQKPFDICAQVERLLERRGL
jgi:PAS domain S-box-containing protein